jgi:hypothetical protein
MAGKPLARCSDVLMKQPTYQSPKARKDRSQPLRGGGGRETFVWIRAPERRGLLADRNASADTCREREMTGS